MTAAGLPVAVTMGEPAGIGPDIVLMAYAARQTGPLPPFVLFGSLAFLKSRARRLSLDIELIDAGPEIDSSGFETALPVRDGGGDIPDHPGRPDAIAATAVIGAIEAGVRAIFAGQCMALVTAPIQKSILYDAGFTYPGHTEFLAALCANGGTPPTPVMMLAHEGFRTVPLTVHIPLRDVPAAITAEKLVATARIVAADLTSRFNMANPRLAVTGLNPHAGENGAIGTEDRDIIAPAIAQLAAEGLQITGPHPADTLFHPPHWQQYDCVIAMYHDQALIPIKTLAFDQGVNITLGLPIVRTSPDHGTALSLAGTGKASTKSFVNALRLAHTISGATR